MIEMKMKLGEVEMKRNIKKWLASLITLCAIVMVIPMTALSAQTIEEGEIVGDFRVIGGKSGIHYLYEANIDTLHLFQGGITIQMATPGATTTTHSISANFTGAQNVTLDNVSIDRNGRDNAVAFEIRSGSASITLVGENRLIAGNNKAGVDMIGATHVSFEGDGSLYAGGGRDGDGIGGSTEGRIFVGGGTVTAVGGEGGQAITGKYAQIRAGKLIAKEIATTNFQHDTVSDDMLWTDGETWIETNSISDRTYQDQWKGIIIWNGTQGIVYGEAILPTNTEIPRGVTLHLQEDDTLEIGEGKTLTNFFGEISISGGEIVGSGSIVGSGMFETDVMKSEYITNVEDYYLYTGEVIPVSSGANAEPVILGKPFKLVGDKGLLITEKQLADGITWEKGPVQELGTYRVRFSNDTLVEASKTFYVVPAEDATDINAAKALIEGHTFSLPTADSIDDYATLIAQEINNIAGLSATGVKPVTSSDIEIDESRYIPSINGDDDDVDGANGSLSFRVNIKNNEMNLNSGNISLTIQATHYSYFVNTIDTVMNAIVDTTLEVGVGVDQATKTQAVQDYVDAIVSTIPEASDINAKVSHHLDDQYKVEILFLSAKNTKYFNVAMNFTTGDFVVTGGTAGLDYTFNAPYLFIHKPVPLTISNKNPAEPTSHVIRVHDRSTNYAITLNGVNIDVSSIENRVAFEIVEASTVNVTLAEGSVNRLISGDYKAGLQLADNATVSIDGTGELFAKGGSRGAGIGGALHENGGNIIIKNGIITAVGGYSGAGIGRGAVARYSSAVTIEGGTIVATGGDGQPGIGGKGFDNVYTAVTISGGTVTATQGYSGWSDIRGIFSTTGSGNAFIYANIDNTHNSNWQDWNGFIFEDKTDGLTYGQPVLTEDATLPEGKVLTANNAYSITIPENVTFTNNGTITVHGTITNNGTFINNGTITEGDGTLTGSGAFQTTVLKDEYITGIKRRYEYTGAEIEIDTSINNPMFFGEEFVVTGWDIVIEKLSDGSWQESTVQGKSNYRVRYTNAESADIVKTFSVKTINMSDANDDNVVDAKDLQMIAHPDNYNKEVTEVTPENQLADVNGDGKINFADLAMARNSKNFGK